MFTRILISYDIFAYNKTPIYRTPILRKPLWPPLFLILKALKVNNTLIYLGSQFTAGFSCSQNTAVYWGFTA